MLKGGLDFAYHMHCVLSEWLERALICIIVLRDTECLLWCFKLFKAFNLFNYEIEINGSFVWCGCRIGTKHFVNQCLYLKKKTLTFSEGRRKWILFVSCWSCHLGPQGFKLYIKHNVPLHNGEVSFSDQVSSVCRKISSIWLGNMLCCKREGESRSMAKGFIGNRDLTTRDLASPFISRNMAAPLR